MAFRTLDDLPDGARVLVRVDLNSPIEDGAPQDNRRFARHAETIRELVENDHPVALLAHQGRPGRDDFTTLAGHAGILSSHLGRDVQFVPDTYGEEALGAIRALEPGEVLLLENVRACEDELADRTPQEHAESGLVRTLAPEFDAYVNDAYSAAHRAHASLVGFPLAMESFAGRVMESEYEFNTSVASRDFDGPVTMVCGGNKSEDVIDVIEALEGRVDNFLVGGLPGELFLRAKGSPVGYDVGTDLLDDQWDATHGTLEVLLEDRGDQIHLPVDLAYDDDGERAEVDVGEIEEKGAPYLDVGEGTVEAFAPVIRESAAVFTKGALGVFEDERFARGTVGVLEAIADSDCFSVVGGGDTSRAIELYGLDEADFDHLSIAGGAYLRALTGRELPAVRVL